MATREDGFNLSTPGPVKKITIAASSADVSALVFIAEKNGFFVDNGLDVKIEEYEAGIFAVDAVTANTADFATVTDFAFVRRLFGGNDLRVVGSIAEANTHKLVARKDSGISTPADLKGKRIGITSRTTGEYFLGIFLARQNLSVEDVTIVDLPPSGLVESILAGDIDATLTWDPNAFLASTGLGDNAIVWPGQKDQTLFFLLIGQESRLKSEPEVVERLLSSLLKAEEYVANNPEQAKKFTQEKFGYESPYLESLWPNISLRVTLPQELLIALEERARWVVRNELVEDGRILNYLNYIYLDGLDKIKPEAVTIIR
ncbi:MAG: NrtA/SsuA/CpmA family ABC transporter substrate-binding protein [Candidatus Paceibacterota bacterium]